MAQVQCLQKWCCLKSGHTWSAHRGTVFYQPGALHYYYIYYVIIILLRQQFLWFMQRKDSYIVKLGFGGKTNKKTGSHARNLILSNCKKNVCTVTNRLIFSI